MNFSRRKTAITLLLMGFWLIFCAFQPSIKSNYLISNELYFYTTNLLFSKYTTIFNLTTQELSNLSTPKSHESSFSATKSIASKYTSISSSTLGELTNTIKLKRQFWYDDLGLIYPTIFN